MKEIANLIVEVLSHTKPSIVQKTGIPSKAQIVVEASILEKSRKRVRELLDRFPLYPELAI